MPLDSVCRILISLLFSLLSQNPEQETRFIPLSTPGWMRRKEGEVLLLLHPSFGSIAMVLFLHIKAKSPLLSQEHPQLETAMPSQLSTTLLCGHLERLWKYVLLSSQGFFASILSTKSRLRKIFSQYFPCSVCRRVQTCNGYRTLKAVWLECWGASCLSPD